MENNTGIPLTQTALVSWMQQHCYNFNEYSINGNHIHEGFGIDIVEGIFRWYFTERGQKNSVFHFKSEAEIVAYAFDQIKADTWARAHCIGFTTDKKQQQELQSILQTAGIEFLQDEIPYYGAARPVYRTFVSGCDHKMTQHLREKYYHEP